MKIVFLDIDGVLNSNLFWYEKRQHLRYKELPEDAPKGAHDICEKCVKHLNKLLKDTGAKVVVSSTWRNNRSIEELQNVLEYKGFTGEVIGKTPNLWYDSEVYKRLVPRGSEIQAWLKSNKELVGQHPDEVNYVILDDDSDMLYEQRHRYLNVDSYVGLTPNVVYKAKRILNS